MTSTDDTLFGVAAASVKVLQRSAAAAQKRSALWFTSGTSTAMALTMASLAGYEVPWLALLPVLLCYGFGWIEDITAGQLRRGAAETYRHLVATEEGGHDLFHQNGHYSVSLVPRGESW